MTIQKSIQTLVEEAIEAMKPHGSYLLRDRGANDFVIGLTGNKGFAAKGYALGKLEEALECASEYVRSQITLANGGQYVNNYRAATSAVLALVLALRAEGVTPNGVEEMWLEDKNRGVHFYSATHRHPRGNPLVQLVAHGMGTLECKWEDLSEEVKNEIKKIGDRPHTHTWEEQRYSQCDCARCGMAPPQQ